jgi:hypothetical protein
MLRPVIGEGASGAMAVNLGFDHWRLDRKLRDIFHSAGAEDRERWRLTELIQAALARTAPADTAPFAALAAGQFDAGRFAALIIEENYSADDFRRLLGINVFEDITWYNKEGFDACLFYGSLFFVLESGDALERSIDAQAAAAKKAAAGEKAARAKPAGKTLPWLGRAARIGEIADALTKAGEGAGYHLDELLNALGDRGVAAKPPALKPAAKTTAAGKAAAQKPSARPKGKKPAK